MTVSGDVPVIVHCIACLQDESREALFDRQYSRPTDCGVCDATQYAVHFTVSNRGIGQGSGNVFVLSLFHYILPAIVCSVHLLAM